MIFPGLGCLGSGSIFFYDSLGPGSKVKVPGPVPSEAFHGEMDPVNPWGGAGDMAMSSCSYSMM